MILEYPGNETSQSHLDGNLPAGNKIGCGLNLYKRLRSWRIGAAQAAQASSVARAANCKETNKFGFFFIN